MIFLKVHHWSCKWIWSDRETRECNVGLHSWWWWPCPRRRGSRRRRPGSWWVRSCRPSENGHKSRVPWWSPGTTQTSHQPPSSTPHPTALHSCVLILPRCPTRTRRCCAWHRDRIPASPRLLLHWLLPDTGLVQRIFAHTVILLQSSKVSVKILGKWHHI